jgi:protein tyrosine/serine phosphatase
VDLGQPFAFEGVRNFRDFGGGLTVDGRRIRTGRLFRSAHLAEASAADIARLEALGVKLVADLRHPAERMNQPARWPHSAGPPVICRQPVQPALQVGAPLQADTHFSAAVARENMLGAYRRIPADPDAMRLFCGLLGALAEHGGPILVHCTAGKDRTGIACAIVLAALGCGHDTIQTDYLRTNDGMDVAARRREVRTNLEPEIGRPLADEEIEPLLGVEAAYLAAAMAIVEAAGGIDAYLGKSLGLPRQTRERLRMQLCE